jgi:hypothetical protein
MSSLETISTFTKHGWVSAALWYATSLSQGFQRRIVDFTIAIAVWGTVAEVLLRRQKLWVGVQSEHLAEACLEAGWVKQEEHYEPLSSRISSSSPSWWSNHFGRCRCRPFMEVVPNTVLRWRRIVRQQCARWRWDRSDWPFARHPATAALVGIAPLVRLIWDLAAPHPRRSHGQPSVFRRVGGQSSVLIYAAPCRGVMLPEDRLETVG